MRILHISPHLSTGGLPEFLYQILKKTHKQYENFCIEYQNLGEEFVVQKKKIKNLLGDNFYSPQNLLDLILKIDPEIIYLHEIPELFMSSQDAELIYSNDRKYRIIESSHDSSFDVANKRYLPNAFGLISSKQIQKFSKFNIPIVEIETDFELKVPNKKTSIEKLSLNPNKKHVINVGLFTPRKNQAESLIYAEIFKERDVHFHFIGNMAGNFKDYWEPLWEKYRNLENVFFWGEREDVDLFYQAADLMIFTSKMNGADSETKPLVIREASEYNLPILMRDIENYQGYYNKFENIKFLKEGNENIKLIEDMLSLENESNFEVRFDYDSMKFYLKTYDRETYHVYIKETSSGHSLNDYKFDFEKNDEYWLMPIPRVAFDFYDPGKTCSGFQVDFYKDDLLKYSHFCPIPDRDPGKKDKPITKSHRFFRSWLNYMEFFRNGYYDYIPNDIKVCVDIGANMGLASQFFETKGAEKLYLVDADPNNCALLKEMYGEDSRYKVIHKACSGSLDPEIKFYARPCSSISSLSPGEEGEEVVEVSVANTNLKHLLLEIDETKIDLLKIDIEGAEYELFESEPIETFNNIKYIHIEVHDLIDKRPEILIEKLRNFTIKAFSHGKEIDIQDCKKPGLIDFFAVNNNFAKKSISVVQSVTNEELLSKRFAEAHKTIEHLVPSVMVYKSWKDSPPSENCARPEKIKLQCGNGALTPAHYGCFNSMRESIKRGFDSEDDFVLYFESDAKIIDKKEFELRLEETKSIMLANNLTTFSFGGKRDLDTGEIFASEVERLNDWSFIPDRIILAHALLFHKKDKDFLIDSFSNEPWDAADLFLNNLLIKYNRKSGITDKALVTQEPGFSMIDKIYKKNEHITS